MFFKKNLIDGLDSSDSLVIDLGYQGAGQGPAQESQASAFGSTAVQDDSEQPAPQTTELMDQQQAPSVSGSVFTGPPAENAVEPPPEHPVEQRPSVLPTVAVAKTRLVRSGPFGYAKPLAWFGWVSRFPLSTWRRENSLEYLKKSGGKFIFS